MADNEEVASQLGVALTDFKKKNLRGVLAGIKTIGGVFQGVETDVNDCIAAKSDLDRIKVWASIFKHPLTVAKTIGGNVRKNYVKITKDIANNAKAFKRGNWDRAGKTIADLMIQALGPVPPAEEEDVVSFVDQIDNVDIDELAGDGNRTSEEILAALMISQKKSNKFKKFKKTKNVKLMLMLI